MIKRPSSWLFYLLSSAAILVFILFVALPGLFPLFSCLFSGSARKVISELFTNHRQVILLIRSVGIATAVSVLSTIVGGTLGFSLQHTRARIRKWLFLIMMVNFLIPSYIFTLAWIDLSGHAGILRRIFPQSEIGQLPILYSSLGTVFVQTLSFYPIPALAAALSLRRLDSRFEEAGRIFASRWKVFCHITLPLILPGILTGSLIVFLFSLLDFSVPSLLQVNTYPVEIYMRFSISYDYNDGFSQALPLVFIASMVLMIWQMFLRPRFGWLESRKTLSVDRSGSLMLHVAIGIVIFVSPVLPVLMMLWRSWPLTSFIEAFSTTKEELLNSGVTAVISATGVAMTAFCLRYLLNLHSFPAARGKVRMGDRQSSLLRGGKNAFVLLSAIPFLISGPVLGIALIRIWNHAGFRGVVYDSFFILSLACLGKFFFIGERGMSMILHTVAPRIEEPARLAGLTRWSRLWRIQFPICRPVFTAIWAFVFILSIGELGASVLVAPPGFTPLAVRLFSLMHYGPSRLIAALSLIMVAVITVGTALSLWLLERMDRESI